jgi:hypothetical protein
MDRLIYARYVAVLMLLAASQPVRAQFDLQFTVNPAGFSAAQLTVLQDSLDTAEAMWESVVTGYQPGV